MKQTEYFDKIDLGSRYRQIKVKSKDNPKTVFMTRRGQYEFVAMFLGQTNTPACLMNLINKDIMDEKHFSGARKVAATSGVYEVQRV